MWISAGKVFMCEQPGHQRASLFSRAELNEPAAMMLFCSVLSTEHLQPDGSSSFWTIFGTEQEYFQVLSGDSWSLSITTTDIPHFRSITFWAHFGFWDSLGFWDFFVVDERGVLPGLEGQLASGHNDTNPPHLLQIPQHCAAYLWWGWKA